MQRVFRANNLSYPPQDVAFLAFKNTKLLQVYVTNAQKKWVKIKEYPILAASGILGPKLREGDMQVPEGIYKVTYLNPNSRFHLSLRLNYPNEFDKRQAAKTGRGNLGSDIMIHGNAVSAGCLAMGDPAIEELFVLVADVGMSQVEVVISPVDFRADLTNDTLPTFYFASDLYAQIKNKLRDYVK